MSHCTLRHWHIIGRTVESMVIRVGQLAPNGNVLYTVAADL